MKNYNPFIKVPYSVSRKHTFFRFCRDCGERFQPSGKGSVICLECYIISKIRQRCKKCGARGYKKFTRNGESYYLCFNCTEQRRKK